MLNHNYIGTEHILPASSTRARVSPARRWSSSGSASTPCASRVREIIGQGQQAPTGHIPSRRAPRRCSNSPAARRCSSATITSGPSILLGLIREGEGVAAQVLVKLGADLARVRQTVIQLISGYQGGKEAAGATAGPGAGPAEGTPAGSLVLDQFGRNLTVAAREGKLDPVIGREKEIERVMQVLSRRTKNNPVLIGEPGVGKTAVVEGLAQDIVRGDVPETLKDKQLHPRPRRARGGSRYRGDFEERLKKVLGGDPHPRRHRALHRRDPHPRRCRCGRGRHRRGEHPQADAGPR